LNPLFVPFLLRSARGDEDDRNEVGDDGDRKGPRTFSSLADATACGCRRRRCAGRGSPSPKMSGKRMAPRGGQRKRSARALGRR